MPVGDSPRDEGVGDTASIIPEVPQEPTGVFENIAAGYRSARAGPASTLAHENAYAKPYYEQIVSELNKREPGKDFSNPLGMHLFDPVWSQDPLGKSAVEIERIWGAVAQERQRDPNFLKDIPDRAALHERIRQDRVRDMGQAEEIMSRAGKVGTVAGFVGQIAGGWDSPENYVGGFGGAAGKATAKAIVIDAVKEGGANAAAGLVALPGVSADSHDLGMDMTPGQMAEQVGENFGFGVAAHGVKIGAPALARAGGRAAAKAAQAAVEHLPEPVRNAAIAASVRAGTLSDRAVTSEIRRNHAPFTVDSTLTPEAEAAVHVVERDADVREASPFHAANDPANDQRLTSVMDDLGVAPKLPEAPSPAPLPANHPAVLAPSAPHVAGYGAAIIKAEGLGDNPSSSSSGYGQFSKGTWLGLYKKTFGAAGMSDNQILALRQNRDIGTRMVEAYGQENGAYLRAHGQEDSAGNRSLAHFLGPADALKILQADPAMPVERVIAPASFRANEKLLQGKSASELIKWAHRRIGDASGLPVARADAVPDEPSPFDDYAPGALPPIDHRKFRPDELVTDAAAMQYKSGGDEAGVTNRLAGVEQWNPLLSGKMVVWERADGSMVVADGHQRLGLAQRLSESDPNIRLDGVVVREADGVTAQMARVAAALKNIEEGSGTAIDTARVLRDAPDGLARLSPQAPGKRMAEGLVRLSNEAFGAVLNDVIDPRLAAQIGNFAGDSPETHMALIALLKRSGVTAPDMAGTVVKQALSDGFQQGPEAQMSFLGETPQTALYGPAARVLDAARRRLKEEKRSFKTLTSDAARIERAGNKLDRGANQAKVIDNETALAILEATAHRSGPVRDALLAAARRHLDGDRHGATDQFLRDLEGIDLRAAAAGMGESASAGGASEPTGHPFDGSETDAELADGRGLPGGPSPYDDAVAAGQSSLGFSEPTGTHADAQADMVAHDLKLSNNDGTFRLSEEGEDRTFVQIIADADAQIAAVEALKGCL